jgi:type VI secretion system secreted protein VgrG
LPDPPEAAKEAIKADPGESNEPPQAPQPPKPATYSSSAKVLQSAAADGTPFCEKCEEAKLEEESAIA